MLQLPDDVDLALETLSSDDAGCVGTQEFYCDELIALRIVREQYVRDCLQDRRRSRQDCQEEAKWYGESTSGPNRSFIRGMYYDLPECQEAARAWKAWEESRPGMR